MKTLLIINNDDLFDLLKQIQISSPQLSINHITTPTHNVITNNSIILLDYKDIHLAQGHEEHSICFTNSTIDKKLPKGINLIKAPYRISELSHMIQNIIKRIDDKGTNMEIGSVTIIKDEKSLTIEGKKIPLTEKEYEIIVLLYENKGKIIGRDKILQKVWGYNNDIDTHTVETHIYRIRQKTGKDHNFILSDKNGYYIS